MTDQFWGGLVLTCLLLLVGHWLPWPAKLPRILAYAYGVASILTGLVVWLWQSNRAIWFGILAYCVAGGLITLAAYAYDVWRNHEVLRQVDDDRPDRRIS